MTGIICSASGAVSFFSCLKFSQFISLHFKFRRYFYNGSENNKLENGNIFLELSSHYRQVSRYNTRSSFLPVSADKIGGREIIALNW